jgi:hypothetical protein
MKIKIEKMLQYKRTPSKMREQRGGKKENSRIGKKRKETAESKRQNRRLIISAKIYMIIQNRIRNQIPRRVNIRRKRVNIID